MTKEVMKLALEALETAWYHVGTFAPTDDAIELYDQARKSLRQALAKQEQDEPKEWVSLTNEEIYEVYETTEKLVGEHWDNGGTILMFPTTLYQTIEAKLKEKNCE